ncbi:MAG: nuclear transport factor 2 family protein [Armatimonadota bacterium]
MTGRTRLLIGLCLLPLAAVGAWLLLREPKSPREQIAETILSLERAVEAQDVAGCIRLFSPDYRDSQGITRAVLRRLATEGLRDAQSIDITAYEPEITFTESGATARVEAIVTAVTSRGRQEWPLTVTFTLQRERRRWRIVAAEDWQHLMAEW